MDTQIKIPKGIDINENVTYEKYRINPATEIEKPPTILEIGDKPVMTSGNFSLTLGKAKSAKTFYIGAIVAGFLSENTQLNRIKGTPQENQNVALYFDTEQSTYHANKSIKRIAKLTGDDNLYSLRAYSLRALSPRVRLEVIEDLICSTENLGLVIIDGVRDLLTNGINDEAEATKVASLILKWTAELNIHIILVLHQNKNDYNARGHIGTELVNKAETVISVTKKNPECFMVSCMESRDIPFDDFAFKIMDGIPCVTDLPTEGQTKKLSPEEIDDDRHHELLLEIYDKATNYNYAGLQEVIINGFNKSFGLNASRNYINYYLAKGWIKKVTDGQKKKYYLC